MKKLVIFGVGEQAELAYFYFKNESDYDVVAFTVDHAFIKHPTFIDELPVVAMEDLLERFPPEKYECFVAVGYSKVNQVRTKKYLELKEMGYTLASFVSAKATNYAQSIGDNCFILEDNTIQPFVEIGNNVTLWSGNHIGHHSVIEDHCFITSQVVVSGGCRVGAYTFIGVNSTLRDHIHLGLSNVIGAGALILKNTEDNAVFMEKGTEMSKVPSQRLRTL